MRTALALASIVHVCAMLAVAQHPTQPLRFLGNDKIPPLIFLENGRPTGLVVDLAQAMAEKAHLSIRVEAMDWPTAQNLVSSGQAAALLQINPTSEREELYDFSDVLLESNFHIFRKSTRTDLRDIRSLDGMKVGVEAGGLAVLFLKNHERIGIVTVESCKIGVAMLHDGQIDAMLVDRWVGEYELSQRRITGISVVDPPIVKGFSRIAVQKGNSELLKSVNAGLIQIQRDGTRQQILSKWQAKEVVYFTWEAIQRVGIGAAIACVAMLTIIAWRARAHARAMKAMNQDLLVQSQSLAREIEQRRSAEEALRQANEALDQRVAQRTTELREANDQQRREITERERVERALWERDARFTALLENLHSGVALIDERGQFVLYNESFLRIFGLKSLIDNVNSQDWNRWRVFAEDGRHLHVDEHPVRRAAQSGKPVRDQLVRVKRPSDGQELWLLVSAQPISRPDSQPSLLICTYYDITERRQLMQTLLASEERLRQALGATNTAMWDWKPPTGQVFWSPEHFTMLGYEVGSVEPSYAHWAARIHPDDLPGAEAAIRSAMRERREYHHDFRVILPNQQVRWLDARANYFYNAAGECERMLGVMYDVTQRKQAEEQLKTAKISAEQANRAKDQFLAVLSHELRNPLSPVLAAASMLRKNNRLDAETQRMLEIIHRNAELEARLIDDLLDVTRIVQNKIELNRHPVELCTIIERAVEVCRPDIDARQLHFGVDPGPDGSYMLDADPARVQQVLWNLLKNSIKFTPPGGSVAVRCHREGNCVLIEVSDNGEGIAPDALGRIFNAFEQVERLITRQFGGLGLGLTISKAMVEMHGGTITAASDGKGMGSTFTVRLPLLQTHHGPRDAPQTRTTHGSESPARPARILLVEDHVDTANIMMMLLTAEGHDVRTAGNLSAGLELAQKERFDLLISDLGLPDGTGVDLMRELRKRGHQMPGIALSGYGQDEDIRRTREAGFAAHLTKPTDPACLAKIIATLTGQQKHA